MHLTVVDWQDGAHHNPFLQLVPASCSCLGRVADTEFVKVLGYETLDAWWYVEEVEREADELLGYQKRRPLQDPAKPRGDLICGSWLHGFSPRPWMNIPHSYENLEHPTFGKVVSMYLFANLPLHIHRATTVK